MAKSFPAKWLKYLPNFEKTWRCFGNTFDGVGNAKLQENNRSLKSKVQKELTKRIGFLRWAPTYSRMFAFSDFIAGLTLGLTIVPQSIAYASLARLPAENGLYSAFSGGFLYVLFGTIPQVSIGPTSLMSLLTMQYIGNLPDENKIQYLCLLTFLCGFVELLMGLLHLGFLTEIISTPVISGFTSASAVIIVESQIKHILGISFDSDGIMDGLIKLFERIDRIKVGDTMLGVVCIALLLTLRQFKNISFGKNALRKLGWFISVSRNVIIVILCCLTAYCIESSGSRVPFKLTANVTSGIPAPKLPTLHIDQGNTTQTSFETIKKLGNGFITIPIVAVLINVSIAKAFVTAGTIDATQEMLTLSLCNMFASCFSAMPICGAFTRSAVSNASGVKTPFSNFYSALVTIFALTFLTPWFRYIPKATLAAVLIAAVIFLIDVQILKPLWKSCKRDFFILLATFFLCLYFGVEIGLLIGAFGNLIYLLYLWARPRITREKHKNEYGEYLVITPDIGLFYLGTDYLYTYLAKIARQNRNKLPVAVNCCYFKSMDYTAIKGLSMISQDYKNVNQQLVFYNVCDSNLKVYKNSGCTNIQFYGVNENLNEYLFSKEIDFRRSVTIPIMDTELQELGANKAQRQDQSEVESLFGHENEKNTPTIDT